MDDHSSGTPVAGRLLQPTRITRTRNSWYNQRYSYLVLLPVGFTLPCTLPARAVRSYRTLSPLPPDKKMIRRFTFCGTCPGVTPAGRYPAPCFRGARTFLPHRSKAARAITQPSGCLSYNPASPLNQSAAFISPIRPPNIAAVSTPATPSICIGQNRR